MIGFEYVFEKGMCFAIDDLVAGPNGAVGYRLAMWLLPVPGDLMRTASSPSRMNLPLTSSDQLKEFLLGELGIEAPIEFRESEPLLEAECAEAGFSGP